MKVAILFFGEVRGTPDIWEKINNYLVQPNQADVFMHHVYYGNQFIESIPESQQQILKEYYQDDKKGVHLYPPKELFDIFHPKKILIETRPDYSKEDVTEMMAQYKHRTVDEVKFLYHMIRSQAESRKKVNRLKCQYEQENNFKYDVVILTRLDIAILEPITITIKPSTIQARILGIIEDQDVPNSVAQIYEQVIFGPSKQMDLVSLFYDHAPQLYKEFNLYLEFMRNEFFISQHIVRCGLTIEHYPIPLAYRSKENPNGLKRSNSAFI
uniref:Uncharacterized protein n=1 Tax=viral metagenome TaxID=1070528 RepID=A0A6C0CSG4_9ZZZZ